MKKISLKKKILLQQTDLTGCFIRDMLRNGIPSCCLFRRMVRNRIPSVCWQFFSRERNSELFSLPRNGSERNSERLLLILFHGTEFRAFFSSAERFWTEFREFSVLRNSRSSAGTNQLFHLFRLPRNNFFVGNCQPYWRYRQSWWHFRPLLWTSAPLTFSLVYLPPPPSSFPVWISTGACIYTKCNGGGDGDQVVWRASTGVIHCVFEQIPNLQNCFTTPKTKT
jgi:hypothetical protein